MKLEIKNLFPIFEKAQNYRVESFKVRNEQMEIFKQSNTLSIKSLKARLKGDLQLADDIWQQAINLKEQAKNLSDTAQSFQEKASSLEGVYYAIVEEFTNQ